MKPPSLESLSTIQADGSRRFVHPADVRGPLTKARRLVAWLLIAFYAALPWIRVGGHPAVFLDVQTRRFHFMGLVLATQDLWIGFFLITGLAFGLFYLTALFGRLWCGWACPYTVLLEHLYRRIERWVDGDASARRRLDQAPLNARNLIRRLIKHSLYLLLSAAIAHLFLSYFVSIEQLYRMMQGPPREHLQAFGVVLFLTAALYFCFSWFREQFCIILCPYGRLQSALTDEHSIVIGYDRRRGEPRGKAGSTDGACVDCRRCVQVCPTGIDIRNGLQLECIGCAACVDACDEVMVKLKRPPGLVRYASQMALQGGRTRWLRPRILLYSIMLMAGLVALGLSLQRISPLHVAAVRMVGAPFYVANGQLRNQFLLRVINKRHEAMNYRIALEPLAGSPLPASLKASGTTDPLHLDALGETQVPIIFSLPVADFKPALRLRLRVDEENGKVGNSSRVLELLGPDPNLQTHGPLDAKSFIR